MISKAIHKKRKRMRYVKKNYVFVQTLFCFACSLSALQKLRFCNNEVVYKNEVFVTQSEQK